MTYKSGPSLAKWTFIYLGKFWKDSNPVLTICQFFDIVVLLSGTVYREFNIAAITGIGSSIPSQSEMRRIIYTCIHPWALNYSKLQSSQLP